MNGVASEPPSLDAADYDPIQHLNLLFSHPSTVSSISRVSSTLQSQHNDLSAEISSLQTAQAYGPDSSLERMQSAQAELAGLFKKIETVRSRAIQTEQNITSMTADIKRLDGTKRNLTLSMTALKRLQMLTTAYEQLRGLAKTRQYRECASLLQAVLQLMRHFNSYRSIDQIATLSRGVGELQRELLEQVCEDFEIAFAKGEIGARKATLVEACGVMDALGDNARARLVTWYVNTELREYRQVFRGNDEAGSLDNIGRRYAWFKRMMKVYEEEHAAIFPPHWRVGETLAMAFCDGTRDDYKGILEKSMRRIDGPKIDVNLLLGCLQETMDFEQTLERRFASEPRASIDTLSSADERTQSFNGSISVAFEPYLSLWVESQDKALAAMIPKYKAQPLLPPDEEFSPQAVISSAIELFHFYKLTLSQCAKLSTSERLLDLTKTLAKYLDEYAQQVLLAILQRPGQAGGASLQDVVLVLNTADFWHANTGQLEENIKKRIDSELVSKVDLSSQADAYLGVASAAVIALVNKVEADCEGAWREMKNTNWSKMESVGDQSSYVGELVSHVNAKAEEILAVVVKQQYARAFADKLVEHLAHTYIHTIVQCRPISEVGAEQMLLDKYVLTKALENLLSHHNPSSQPQQHVPPSSFVKRVNATMTRIDPLLKTLQVRPSPPEGLVQAYLIHVGDRSDTNFRKVLELKGIRKQDQGHLMELFSIHRDGPGAGDKLVAQSPLLTPLMNAPGLGGVGVGATNLNLMSIDRLASGPGAALSTAAQGAASRFDAASLGEKLLNAARDGVERMGTPAAHELAQQQGGGAGQNNAASINENLKNFGKFFRRDIGGLGVRFGKRDGSADEH
ncbi:Vps53-like protein [Hypoxylon sp. FL1857]|nr:Vps53-like protein [Hypoxylon sp. FL1857]